MKTIKTVILSLAIMSLIAPFSASAYNYQEATKVTILERLVDYVRSIEVSANSGLTASSIQLIDSETTNLKDWLTGVNRHADDQLVRDLAGAIVSRI